MDAITTETPAPAEAVPAPVVAPVQPETPPPTPEPATPAPPSAEVEPAEISAPAANLTEASEALMLAHTVNESPEVIRALERQVEQFRRADAPAAPAAEPAAPPAAAEPAAAQTPDPTAPTAGEQPPEEDFRVPDRVRTTHLNEQDRALHNAVMSLTKAGIPLTEAVQRVMGTTAQPAPATAPVEAAAAVPAPVPSVDRETEMTELRAQIEAQEGIIRSHGEREALPTAETANAHIELARLRGELSDVKVKALEEKFAEIKQTTDGTKAEAQARFEAAQDTALDQACQTWPDLENSESAHWKLTKLECQDARANPEHPLHGMINRADFVKYAAEHAAKSLGKTPAPPKSAPAPNAAAPPPAERPPGPVSGNKGSKPAAPPVSQADRVAKSEADLMASLTGEPIPDENTLPSRRAGIIR